MLDTAFLDTMSCAKGASWLIKLHLGDRETLFKMDTGAEVTAISEVTHKHLGKPELDTPSKVLHGPSRQPLSVMGVFKGNLTYGNRSSEQPVFVVRGLRSNLLGLPAITALHLAARVDATFATEEDVREKFPSVFRGLGSLGEKYEIRLKPDAKPHALFTPRHVPLPLRSKVKEELARMESLGVISKVDEPTPWCSGIVIVPKKAGTIRICVDLKRLNENVLRQVHPLPKVDETLAQLAGAKIFSKIDANCGFWQVPLEERSRLLTTFITPFGRYCFNKLPFGISSAPEHFQKQMSRILSGLDGVLCQMDDVLVFGKDKPEHDARLTAVLGRIEAAGATLNPAKCEFSRDSLKFLGHMVDRDGIRADPEKTAAIQDMQPPNNISELRRFLGMTNQLGKFSMNMAELTQPLRELLRKNHSWLWGPSQEQAFALVKAELAKPTTLALYDVEVPTKISADASSFGLGAVLLQQSGSSWKPVAFASRSLSDAERNYAQIEKEALAITWACEKFSDYILGKKVLIETDHKPLVPLLGTKQLDCLPPRVLRFRLRLARFDYDVTHVPGKLMYTADTLSRAPLALSDKDSTLQEQADTLAELHVAHLPASKQRLDHYRHSQVADPVCSAVIRYCQHGWPRREEIEDEVRPYWEVQGELTLHEGLLLYGSRIVVPASLQQATLCKLHQGHQGIHRCRLRARSSVWWPELSRQIASLVKQCPTCSRETTPHKEPLISSELPQYPWQKVASDLFMLDGTTYLLVVDYLSRYPEVIKLSSTTSRSIITALKSVFSRHGVPETLLSDNGPQYASQEFAEFAAAYDFQHTTSSPHYPQSNGLAERTVKTVKKLLREADDPYMASLAYRATPLPWCDVSPAELLFGRRVRSSLPLLEEKLIPQWQYLQEFRLRDKQFKQKQKQEYDRRHGVRPLPEIPADSDVWVNTDGQRTPGQVVARADTPRSYLVETPQGQLRRNRAHLSVMPDGRQSSSNTDRQRPTQTRSPIQTRSRTGTRIGPPERL